ncbi:MAG: hypothetical protein KC496_20060, partial [Anaerolineae bacterium]|nr:hypothetical protein [Anaerolineae bacterium]
MDNRPVRLHLFARWLLWLLGTSLLLGMPVVSAQTDADIGAIDLDSLPDCGFTARSGIPNMNVGAVVINFETGVGCVENLDRTFQIASVPKLFIAGAFYEWM